ncbi:hypothetical protein B566_EDAN010234, partial [Ephemera danica]
MQRDVEYRGDQSDLFFEDFTPPQDDVALTRNRRDYTIGWFVHPLNWYGIYHPRPRRTLDWWGTSPMPPRLRGLQGCGSREVTCRTVVSECRRNVEVPFSACPGFACTFRCLGGTDPLRGQMIQRGFDPRTSGLWAQHASTAPLCFVAVWSVNILGPELPWVYDDFPRLLSCAHFPRLLQHQPARGLWRLHILHQLNSRDAEVVDHRLQAHTRRCLRRVPVKCLKSKTTMIEVTCNDRLGKKVRVKCNNDDTIGDLKKLIAAQTGTRYDKIVLKK